MIESPFLGRRAIYIPRERLRMNLLRAALDRNRYRPPIRSALWAASSSPFEQVPTRTSFLTFPKKWDWSTGDRRAAPARLPDRVANDRSDQSPDRRRFRPVSGTKIRKTTRPPLPRRRPHHPRTCAEGLPITTTLAVGDRHDAEHARRTRGASKSPNLRRRAARRPHPENEPTRRLEA